jgi:hypothetical protein
MRVPCLLLVFACLRAHVDANDNECPDYVANDALRHDQAQLHALGDVEVLEEQDAAAARVELLQRRIGLDSVARRPFVFYISPPKAATTTFASFMNEYMHIPTLHDSGEVYRQLAYDPPIRADQKGPQPPRFEPDYENVLLELNTTKLRTYLSNGIAADASLGFPANTNYQAFADAPWPFLFQWLDQTFPTSKFVFWDREADDWVVSFKELLNVKNWAMEKTPEEMELRRRWRTPNCRIYQLAFTGTQDNCSHFKTEPRMLKAAYDGHVRAVRSYFTGADTPAERKSRFLEVDITGPTAAAEICNFVGSPEELCSDMSRMPKEGAAALTNAPY